MKLSEIKKVKNGKYEMKIDGEVFLTYDDVIIKNNLIYKKEIDTQLYEQIKKDHEYYDAYNKTMSFILKRVRSKKEVENYLQKFLIDKISKSKIIEHLTEIGLLSDSLYIKSYVSDSIYINMDGPNKIKDYLLSIDMKENDIDNELINIDEEIIIQNLRRLISKKIRTNHRLSNKQLQKKIQYDMGIKGYYYNDIERVLSEFNYDSDEELLNLEFEKIYKKLSRKYTGYDLKNRVKQNLYTKGFDLNKVNNLLEKKEE